MMMNLSERLATVNMATCNLDELQSHACEAFEVFEDHDHEYDLKALVTNTAVALGRERVIDLLSATASLFDDLGIIMAKVLDLKPLPVPGRKIVDDDTGAVTDGPAIERTWLECTLDDLADTVQANAHVLGTVYTTEHAEHILYKRAVIVQEKRHWKREAKKIALDIESRIEWLKNGGDPELAALSAGLMKAEGRVLRSERALARWTGWWWPSLESLIRDLLDGTKAKVWSCPWGTVKKSKVNRLVRKPADREAMDFAVDWAEAKGFTDAIRKELLVSKVPADELKRMSDEEAIRNGFDVRPEHEKVELEKDGEDED